MIEKILERLEEEREIAEKELEKCIFKGLPYHDSTEGKIIGIKEAIEIVREVAAEYNNGWIPCSVVDHPEHCKECEVTMIDTHGYTREIAFYTDRWRRAYDEASIIVVAWKEPSEPYKPNGE